MFQGESAAQCTERWLSWMLPLSVSSRRERVQPAGTLHQGLGALVLSGWWTHHSGCCGAFLLVCTHDSRLTAPDPIPCFVRRQPHIHLCTHCWTGIPICGTPGRPGQASRSDFAQMPPWVTAVSCRCCRRRRRRRRVPTSCDLLCPTLVSPGCALTASVHSPPLPR